MIIHKKISYFDLLSFLTYPRFSSFRFLVLIFTMGKKIGRSFKYNRSKLSTPKLKKPILSPSDAHTSYASNLKWTSISYQLDNKNITTNQSNNNTLNTDDINSCVTPQKQNYSVKATSTTTRLTLLNATLHIAPIELHKTKQLPPASK